MGLRSVLASVSVSAALLVLPPTAAAQESRGTYRVSGVIVDATGAVIPRSGVAVRREALGFERRATADALGHFDLEVPSGGEYEVAGLAEGFSVARLRVIVRSGDAREVRLTLRPGTFSEQVTVIGTRVAGGPETLQRIPGSVDIIGPETLELARVLNTSEALRKATGVNVRDEEGLGLRPNIGIRGLNPTRSTKILLLEDGLPLAYAPYGDNATYYHPPIERFDSVEILKGSGQVAFGPVTVGGVVNYLTPGPPSKPSATLRLAGGNRDYVNAHGTAGGTWGRLGLLADYLHKQSDGARENLHSKLNDLNLKGVVELNSRQTLTAKGSYYAEDSQITYSGLRQDEYQANPRANPFANDAFDGWRAGGSIRHAWLLGADALLTTQLYTSRFSRDWWRQSSNSGQRPNDSSDSNCAGMANLDTTCGNEGRLRDYELAGLEPRLRFGHGLFGRRSEAEVGVRAHLERQERRQENGDTPLARSGRLIEDNRRESDAYSAFVQNRVLLGRVTMTPGVRFERILYERTNRLAAAGAGVTGATRLSQWVPGLGLAWAARDTVSLFAGVHRGFAPPRTEDIINNTTGGAVDLDPERSWNYEMGLRSLVRPGLGFDVTLFRMDYENQIIPASLAGGLGATLTNGGETLHQGVELGVRFDTASLLGSEHNVSARAAFTALPTARFEGVRLSNVSGFSNVSVSGNRLPYAPERLLTASAGYSHPSGSSVFLEAVHVSEQFADDLNSVAPSADGQRGLIPSYTVWNATLNVAVPRAKGQIFLAIKNVFDRLYIADRSRGVLPGVPRLLQVGYTGRF